MSTNVDRSTVPHHEAGHCLLAWMHARPGSVWAVFAQENGGSGGFTFHDLAGAQPWERNAVSIAGPLAAAIYAEQHGITLESALPGGERVAVFAALCEALEGAGARLGGDEEPFYTPESLAAIEAGARHRSIEARTLRTLRQHWPAVEAIAQALEAQGALTAQQVDDIFNQHGLQRPGW